MKAGDVCDEAAAHEVPPEMGGVPRGFARLWWSIVSDFQEWRARAGDEAGERMADAAARHVTAMFVHYAQGLAAQRELGKAINTGAGIRVEMTDASGRVVARVCVLGNAPGSPVTTGEREEIETMLLRLRPVLELGDKIRQTPEMGRGVLG